MKFEWAKTVAKAAVCGVLILAVANACAENLPGVAYIKNSAVWAQYQIPVCWVNPSVANVTERGWVQRAVDRSWGSHAQIAFVGWENACPSTNQGTAIRIKIDDGMPNAQGLGTQLLSQPEGIHLNFQYTTWQTGYCKKNEDRRQACIETQAVHEFGHALAFAHEISRCADQAQGIDGVSYMGGWGIAAIMYYCSPEYVSGIRGIQATLNPDDLKALTSFYGQPIVSTDFTFDSKVYMDLNPDVRIAVGGNHRAAYDHFLAQGLLQGRRASIEFDVVYYLNAYPDLKQAFGNDPVKALKHWQTYGMAEGRRGSREVSSAYLLSLKPSLNSYKKALEEWSKIDYVNRDVASADFSPINYLHRYIDIDLATRFAKVDFNPWYGDEISFNPDRYLATLHWIKVGISEGRIGN